MWSDSLESSRIGLPSQSQATVTSEQKGQPPSPALAVASAADRRERSSARASDAAVCLVAASRLLSFIHRKPLLLSRLAGHHAGRLPRRLLTASVV